MGMRPPPERVCHDLRGGRGVTCVLGHGGEGGRGGRRLPVPVGAPAGVAAQYGQGFQGLNPEERDRGQGMVTCVLSHPDRRQWEGTPRPTERSVAHNHEPGEDAETSPSNTHDRADRLQGATSTEAVPPAARAEAASACSRGGWALQPPHKGQDPGRRAGTGLY